ncbi:translesion DNA synthesis-associated protein ImuA [Vibrio sp. AK197]|uniref:Translesion DNA synthesis-associated protein ImuA n=1 Tax=Vibrio olivae TaxID=1243002 RepID=A0ABV5HKM3_9VIBR
MHELVEHLKHKQWLWQGSNTPVEHQFVSTGFDILDSQLSGGFPTCGVVEIQSISGIGELRLLLPQIRSQLCEQSRLIVFIQPPGMLSSQQLAAEGIDADRLLIIQPQTEQHALWAAEQCAKSGACSHLFLWPQQLEIHQARRLQVASETGQCLQFVFRNQQAHSLSLPVNLSLALSPTEYGISVRINKRKGGWQHGQFDIDMRSYWPDLAVKERQSVVVPFPFQRQG